MPDISPDAIEIAARVLRKPEPIAGFQRADIADQLRALAAERDRFREALMNTINAHRTGRYSAARDAYEASCALLGERT